MASTGTPPAPRCAGSCMYAEFRKHLVIVADSASNRRELLDKAAAPTQVPHWNAFAFVLCKLDPESGCAKNTPGFALEGFCVKDGAG